MAARQRGADASPGQAVADGLRQRAHVLYVAGSDHKQDHFALVDVGDGALMVTRGEITRASLIVRRLPSHNGFWRIPPPAGAYLPSSCHGGIYPARRARFACRPDGDGLLETLECYLLDARMHVTLTAEKMFLHKNTVKYRLQRIADRLGFVPGELPESMPLFTACALGRLLRGN